MCMVSAETETETETAAAGAQHSCDGACLSCTGKVDTGWSGVERADWADLTVHLHSAILARQP